MHFDKEFKLVLRAVSKGLTSSLYAAMLTERDEAVGLLVWEQFHLFQSTF